MTIRFIRPFALIFLLWMAACSGPATEPEMVPQPVTAQNGMVVSAQVDASEAGVEILRRGGNAVDAAVATGFALAVTYPAAGNLGGGGFMVIRFPDGTATTYDYREKAPAAATRDMYLDAKGDFVPERSTRGYLASGVPGSVAGLLKAHEAHGTLPLDAVIAPAIQLAEKGFVLSQRQARWFNSNHDTFSEFPGTAKYFTLQEGIYEAGHRFVQQDLAEVLRRIRDFGQDGFYRGKTADLFVAEMERGGGLITHEDLAGYEAVERPPVVGSYRGHRVVSMGPPSSGGVALLQLLNAVEPFDIAEMGFLSSETIHLMGEAERRVYADRAEWLGDPDYANVPIDGLIDKTYMRRRMADFDPGRADSSAAVTHGNPLAHESSETTHYSVVDENNMAVSVTTTLNSSFGSKVVVDGAGFFLNNEMDDFSAKPGVANMYGLVGSRANAIAPGKRMLSSMTPTIVEDLQGRPFIVIGTPGGSTIITTVFQIILNVVDHGMNIQQAVAAPRVHHQWLPDEMRYEPFALPKDVTENLEARGWAVRERRPWGAADGIVIRYDEGNRQLHGGADPRGEDTAVGH